MQYSENLHLNLPEDTDPLEISKLSENFETLDGAVHEASGGVFKVGDLLPTYRADLGADWLLCNGDVLDKGAYPELEAVMPGIETRLQEPTDLLELPKVGSGSNAKMFYPLYALWEPEVQVLFGERHLLVSHDWMRSYTVVEFATGLINASHVSDCVLIDGTVYLLHMTGKLITGTGGMDKASDWAVVTTNISNHVKTPLAFAYDGANYYVTGLNAGGYVTTSQSPAMDWSNTVTDTAQGVNHAYGAGVISRRLGDGRLVIIGAVDAGQVPIAVLEHDRAGALLETKVNTTLPNSSTAVSPQIGNLAACGSRVIFGGQKTRYNSSGDGPANYPTANAVCWLDFSDPETVTFDYVEFPIDFNGGSCSFSSSGKSTLPLGAGRFLMVPSSSTSSEVGAMAAILFDINARTVEPLLMRPLDQPDPLSPKTVSLAYTDTWRERDGCILSFAVVGNSLRCVTAYSARKLPTIAESWYTYIKAKGEDDNGGQ